MEYRCTYIKLQHKKISYTRYHHESSTSNSITNVIISCFVCITSPRAPQGQSTTTLAFESRGHFTSPWEQPLCTHDLKVKKLVASSLDTSAHRSVFHCLVSVSVLWNRMRFTTVNCLHASVMNHLVHTFRTLRRYPAGELWPLSESLHQQRKELICKLHIKYINQYSW